MNNSTTTCNSNETDNIDLGTSDVIVSWTIEILVPCILYAFASIAGSIFNIILIIAILRSRKLRNPPGCDDSSYLDERTHFVPSILSGAHS